MGNFRRQHFKVTFGKAIILNDYTNILGEAGNPRMERGRGGLEGGGEGGGEGGRKGGADGREGPERSRVTS